MLKRIVKKIIGNQTKAESNYPVINTLDKVVKFDEYPNYGILDTSIGSYNLGDFIIMDSVNRELIDTLDDRAYFMTFPTHLSMVGNERKLLLEKELLFISGTNLLNSSMDVSRQWHINKKDLSFYYKRCVLFGVGWGSYEDKPSEETKHILNTVLADQVVHSVRDEYTKKMLNSIGIMNVVNTCCPTTWRLSEIEFNNAKKNENVVTTLTYYSKDLVNDSRMLEILSQNYKKVYLWVQSLQDIEYLKEINLHNQYSIEFIAPSLNAYRSFLENNATNVDYIGTRLHAGIFAMQRKINTLIIGIDNRAIEIGRDIKLPVVKRNEIENILSFIKDKKTPSIELPKDAIHQWKNQFNTKKA